MSDEADEIRDQTLEDTKDGVLRFEDGANRVEMFDPMKRLDVADRIDRRESAAQPHFGLRPVRMIGGAAWQ